MRYHKAHLTRRLILDISADSEIEENMVEWLRVRAEERATSILIEKKEKCAEVYFYLSCFRKLECLPTM